LFTKKTVLKSRSIEIAKPKILDFYENILKKKNIDNVSLEDEYNVSISNNVQIDIQSEYDKIIKKANSQAAMIISEAHNKADKIIKESEKQSQEIRVSVEKSVREEFIPLVREEGYQDGVDEAKKEADKIMEEANRYLKLAQKALADEYSRVDGELITLCIRIAEKIVHASLGIHNQTIMGIIQNLLIMPQEKEGMKVHVSPGDLKWINNLSENSKPSVPIVVDDDLKCGDVYLECKEGIFDARIKSQLERFEQILRKEIIDNELDSD